ncbi:MAG: DUF3300 domain-containing protein [Pseudolabrys sp.]
MILVPVAANAQTPATPASTSSDQLLKAEELDALVAPIALYPDTLLSLVLMPRLIHWRSSRPNAG